jgi:NAD(P)H-dependent FMN reductase
MKLLVVLASTRPGRTGEPVARWFVEHARRADVFDEVELADLAEIGLPLLDEPSHPRFGEYVHEHTRRWSAIVDSADAYVFVMPEYNFSYSAAVKNALDYLSREWQYKPVALVSYGGVSGGMRAQQALKPVLLALRMWPIQDAVLVPMVHEHVRDGVFTPSQAVADSADVAVRELARATAAMQQLRISA